MDGEGAWFRPVALTEVVPGGDDVDKAVDLANRLEVGMVYVNEPPGTAAELPFGGVKRSGVGRELGKYGLEEFANRKLVRIAE